MSGVKLMPHQIEVMKQTEDKNKVAYYLDMGLGKTFVGSEKAMSLHKNILVICQKSKVNDWVEHFKSNYDNITLIDLTDKKDFNIFINPMKKNQNMYTWVGVINYDLVWRRKELSQLRDFTLMLDESSLIQNDTAKRSKFVLNKLFPSNVILLSGTPTSGKYERLWSQMHLLGWNISKNLYLRQYVDIDISNGYPIVIGYKNVDRLKRKMREYGCVFMKTEEVLDLPEQRFIPIKVEETKEYKKFMRTGVIELDDVEFIGDTTLTKLLYARMLCGSYNRSKLDALKDLIESTEDRLIIFYNFERELDEIIKLTDKPLSIVNGKTKDLSNYEKYDNSVTLIQYQAGSMGLNLQKANKIIYFTPTQSSEMYEQSKKRIHRIGQNQKCTYYQLMCGLESKIYVTLAMRKNYTDELFKEEFDEY